jgi:hypothetical protein
MRVPTSSRCQPAGAATRPAGDKSTSLFLLEIGNLDISRRNDRGATAHVHRRQTRARGSVAAGRQPWDPWLAGGSPGPDLKRWESSGWAVPDTDRTSRVDERTQVLTVLAGGVKESARADAGLSAPSILWPPLDLFESQRAFLLRFDVPGVKARDLEVAFMGGLLVVSGARYLAVSPDAPGAAPASGAPGPERTSGAGAAWHAGRRARGRVRGVRATASVRLGSGPVAGPVHPARSSGAAPTPAGLTAVPRRLLIRRGLMLEVPLIVSSPRVAPGRRAAPARSGRLGGCHPPGPPGPGPTGRHPDRPGSQGRPSPAGRR